MRAGSGIDSLASAESTGLTGAATTPLDAPVALGAADAVGALETTTAAVWTLGAPKSALADADPTGSALTTGLGGS